ncbi:hypothetical protein PR002_g13776 [Phytophthora rubi]|uniref:Uncharacterized protein n=1 Tax=Phytophthora rubi TaxID=129364 RepID=A0A6A3LIN7_9STRA|nr:hypothetical protein PR002_g13776 [Phytophthora rubi]
MGFNLTKDGGKHYTRFHSRYFGAHVGKGIRMSNHVLTVDYMSHLLRVCGGKYYLAFLKKELRLKYRPIFTKETMPTYLGTRMRLNELKLVNKDGFESAFVDVMTEVQALRAQLFQMRSEGKKTTFPVLDLRSDRARSGAINFATTKRMGFNLTKDGGKHYTRLHSRYFGAHGGKGIRMSNHVLTADYMSHLLRVCGDKYYLAFLKTELRLKYRPIFTKETMPTYLGRRMRLNELKSVYREGFESAFVDVMTEVKH